VKKIKIKINWVFLILNSKAEIQVAVLGLIFHSVVFRVVPLPDDRWEIAVKKGDEQPLRLSVPIQYYGQEQEVTYYEEQA